MDDIPPHLDHTGTGSFSINAGDHQYRPTVYIPERQPTDTELSNCLIVDIRKENDWDPYKDRDINAINVEQKEVLFAEEGINDYLLESHNRKIRSMTVSKSKDKLTPKYLAQIWNCGLETAEKSIETTTCRYYHQSVDGMQGRFRSSCNMIQY